MTCIMTPGRKAHVWHTRDYLHRLGRVSRSFQGMAGTLPISHFPRTSHRPTTLPAGLAKDSSLGPATLTTLSAYRAVRHAHVCHISTHSHTGCCCQDVLPHTAHVTVRGKQQLTAVGPGHDQWALSLAWTHEEPQSRQEHSATERQSPRARSPEVTLLPKSER